MKAAKKLLIRPYHGAFGCSVNLEAMPWSQRQARSRGGPASVDPEGGSAVAEILASRAGAKVAIGKTIDRTVPAGGT